MFTQERMLSASAAEKKALCEGYEGGLKASHDLSVQKAKDVERRQWALMQALAYDRPFGSSDMEAAALRYLSFLETGSFGESAP